MPNQPRPDNPARAVRIPDELWARVTQRAVRDDVSRSDVIRAALEEYL